MLFIAVEVYDPKKNDLLPVGMRGGIDQLPSIAPSAVHGGSYSTRISYSVSPRFDSAFASTKFDPASVSARFDSTSENGACRFSRLFVLTVRMSNYKFNDCLECNSIR